MASGRTLQLILKRCDADEGRDFNSEQKSGSTVKSEYSSDTPVTIKIEADIISFEPVKSETRNRSVDDIGETSVDNEKQRDCHFQGETFFKVEKEERLITRELVGYTPSKIENHEDSEQEFNIPSHSTGKKVTKNMGKNYSEILPPRNKVLPEIDRVENELLSSDMIKSETFEASKNDTSKTGESFDNSFQAGAFFKMEDEEKEKVRITSELVSHLPHPGCSKDSDYDQEFSLKTVEPKKSEIQSDFECESPAKKEEIAKRKNKILSKTQQKNSKKRYACTECPFRSHCQYSLTLHLRVHSGERPFECELCSKKFKTKQVLVRHAITHTSKRPYECKDCLMKFKTQSCLNRHRTIHTPDRPYKCNICQARFRLNAFLKDHLRRHSEKRSFLCTKFPAKFKVLCGLHNHFKTHSAEKRFACAHCSYKSNKKTELRFHLNRHFDYKPFLCTLCSAKFKQSKHLKEHFTLHSTETPYECGHCNRRFKRRTGLTAHIKTHFDERPFSCTLCRAKFKENGHLKRHLPTHSSEKPFECTECGARFKMQRNLNRHRVIHSDVKPFLCQHCPASYHSKPSLKAHLIAKHTTERL